MRITGTLFAMTLAPFAAMACPSASDMEGGVQLVSPNGEVETFTRLSPDMVQSEYFYEPGEGSRNLLAQGAYLVQINDIVGGKIDTSSRTTYTFLTFGSGKPVPAPGMVWESDVASFDSSGLAMERQIMGAGDVETFTVGDCSYDSIPLSLDYDDGAYREEMVYLIDLGIGVLTRTQEGEEAPEFYVYETIEAVQQ